jgi:hypothetical protein
VLEVLVVQPQAVGEIAELTEIILKFLVEESQQELQLVAVAVDTELAQIQAVLVAVAEVRVQVAEAQRDKEILEALEQPTTIPIGLVVVGVVQHKAEDLQLQPMQALVAMELQSHG